jgi:bifunctional non-homologous end joining protein LigD
VLVSWAVPKGPTLDSSARHLAVHVEDHPLEYADFEGVIPKNQYGAGDVIIWDRGTWRPADNDDPAVAISSGELHFDLHGQKLAGRFVLVRRGDSDQKQWLLLHKDDEHAQPGWDPEQHPRSVHSGRTNDEVAANPTTLWRSDRPAGEAAVPLTDQPPRPTTARATDRRPSSRWSPPREEELRALDDLGRGGRWTVDGRDLALTNLDKILFPARDDEPPVTKRDLIRYHALIAPVMLPYLADRPLNSHRFPDGVQRPGFWHKEVPDHAPKWLRRWRYPKAKPGETQSYLVPDSVAALAWLANYGAVELHAWTSRTTDIDHPTWVLFDIDPGTNTTFEDVLVLARLHRTALEHLGVSGQPKITGQRGIQIWVPLRPRYTYEQTRRWAGTVSRTIGNIVPDLVSWAWSKTERHGLARLDYTQNVLHKTLVAPYSARPHPGAPVSVPIEWDELDDPGLSPDRWTIRTVFGRLAAAGDPFRPLLYVDQELPPL